MELAANKEVNIVGKVWEKWWWECEVAIIWEAWGNRKLKIKQLQDWYLFSLRRMRPGNVKKALALWRGAWKFYTTELNKGKKDEIDRENKEFDEKILEELRLISYDIELFHLFES
jgi:hypothetical protein